MSTLRDEIIRQVERAHSFEGDEHDYVGSDDVADAILALVHDALTSDQAVEAWIDEWDAQIARPYTERVDARSDVREIVTAALDAVGIRKSNDHE